MSVWIPVDRKEMLRSIVLIKLYYSGHICLLKTAVIARVTKTVLAGRQRKNILSTLGSKLSDWFNLKFLIFSRWDQILKS